MVKRLLGVVVIGTMVALAAGCSDDAQKDIAEDFAEDAGGVDQLGLNGEGTAKIGDESFDFEVAACLVDGASINLTAASSDPAVVVNSDSGSITITREGSSFTTTNAEITLDGETLTATGNAEIEAGVPVDDGVALEVTAQCG